MEDIKKLVFDYVKAIGNQNEDDFKKLWSSKENVLISIVNEFHGTDSIYQDFLINAIQANYESIELIVEDINIRLINDELGIVIFKYHTECILRDTKEPYGIEGLETQVVIKENNQWKLVQVHYSK